MSATRDTTQNSKFIFSNFYHLYIQSKASPSDPGAAAVNQNAAPVRGVVLQARSSLASQMVNLRTSRKRLNFLLQEIDDLIKTPS